MNLKCGIIGLPNVGKSSLFNFLTNAKAQAKNYPFCTIEPNKGMVHVPDSRLENLNNIISSEKIIPATVELVDIAGLVKGASSGNGLGNKFLAHIREVNMIMHVVRCFGNKDIIHVSNDINPINDIKTINTELLLSDLQQVENIVEKIKKNIKIENKKREHILDFYKNLSSNINNGILLKNLSYTEEQRNWLKLTSLLTLKPILYVLNTNSSSDKNEILTDCVTKYIQKNNENMVKICISNDNSNNFSPSGVKDLIKCGYKMMKLITYFTVGRKEVKAWTIKNNSTASQAAGKIHTDFEKGFIKARVISYNDYVRYGGYKMSRKVGKERLEGKDYIVNDGDILNFSFNV